MKISLILPCHPRNQPTLSRAIESLKRAAVGFEVEFLVIKDPDSRGPSWARNEGLNRAVGDYIFFADADDVVRPRFFRALADSLSQSAADFAIAQMSISPLKRSYDLSGNAVVREALLPAFFGYSFGDVLRWNSGGELMANREHGSVCRCAFRRDFLDRYRLRFDERLRLNEDAAFLAECATRAEKVVSVDEILYDYAPTDQGLVAATLGTRRYYDYKFAALRNRKAIADRVGYEVMEHFRASAVFSALELLRARYQWRQYIADPFVSSAIRDFPISLRHPLIAGGVMLLRWMLE